MSRFRALWQASLNATKRALTWNLEDLIPPSERYIFNFNSKEELKKWHLYSDSEYGVIDSKDYSKWRLLLLSLIGHSSGLSSASLEIRDAGTELRGVFSGKLSLDVAEDSKWNISRSGFCGMRSKKFDGFIDLDAYDTVALKVKGDGRCYISTEEDNSWQAFVFVPRDNWYIAKIPLARYLPTWRGNIIDVDLEMNPSRIVGMSLSVNAEGGVPGARSGPGDFQVEIDWIKALRTIQ
ncbi:probable complex I intermediate-associated protein 30 isoform X2 [Camellia sinensis]|uniref:probable complex I intermediate-associated protein 30 isoform X2 n=1 Tax=Camellia sinensis TaxID=4442 RepID=UPI001035AA36|nr:probable complex I intermediate-associated protein 30 isoform X2 [Camellia sinensis]